MIIWFAVLIPLLTVVTLVAGFRKKVALAEYLIVFLAPLLLIAGFKVVADHSQISATEYLGGWVTKAEYYEEWNEKVSCRHPKYKNVTRTRTVGTGKNRHTETYTERVHDGYHHSYDVDDHSPYWQVEDSNGQIFRISAADFGGYCQRFSNKSFADLNRHYHSKDGDKYVTLWDQKPETLESTTVKHTYENRVQASDSIFKFLAVDPKVYGLFEYPGVNGFKQSCILGNGGATMTEGEKRLDYFNATLGRIKQVRMFVLVFYDKPMQAAVDQMNYWKGGNKNELVLCVGVNASMEPQWSFPFSWTEVEILKVEARNFVMGQKTLDLVAVANWLGENVKDKWVRKNFADFAYLTVEPPEWAVWTTYIVTLLLCVGLALWATLNRAGSTASFEEVFQGEKHF